jgi:osmotically-inducible protein OsmY
MTPVQDPKVDSLAIAVAADDGTITLRGTVGSFREKREAKNATERVYGVGEVNNELEVRLLDESKREDAELRGDVLQALMLDGFVPDSVDAADELSVATANGTVTLTGAVRSWSEHDAAVAAAWAAPGVRDVDDRILVHY